MAVCAVCSQPCRGTCSHCGARLCFQHKPSGRGKCQVCSSSSRRRMGYAHQAVTPYYTPSHAPPVPISQLDEQELLVYLQDLRTRLAAKQRRERGYLDRRAARGTHTPTDEAYEQDQVLESEIIAMFDQIINNKGGM